MPDMLSKKASVKLNSILEKINGSEPNIAILNQESAVSKKLAVDLIFYHDQDLIKKTILQIQ